MLTAYMEYDSVNRGAPSATWTYSFYNRQLTRYGDPVSLSGYTIDCKCVSNGLPDYLPRGHIYGHLHGRGATLLEAIDNLPSLIQNHSRIFDDDDSVLVAFLERIFAAGFRHFEIIYPDTWQLKLYFDKGNPILINGNKSLDEFLAMKWLTAKRLQDAA